MGFRFYRRIRIAPGVSLNVGKTGASVSVGPRGAKMTFGKKGTRASVGLPGTGVRYEKRFTNGTDGGGNVPISMILTVIFGIVAFCTFHISKMDNSGLFAFVTVVAGLGAVVSFIFWVVSVAFEENESGGARTYSRGSSHGNGNRSRFDEYVRDLASASNDFYAFLRELNRSVRCRNQLKALPGMDEIGRDGNSFTVNQRLGVIVYCDLRDCFRKLGYDDGHLEGLTGIGYAMMVILLASRDFDLNRFLDSSQRKKLLEIVNELATTGKVEMTIADHEDEFRFNIVFGKINNEHEWVQRFSTHMYRWASLIAKADGVVTDEESAALASILEMKSHDDNGANVRVTGRSEGGVRNSDILPQQTSAKPEALGAKSLKEVMNTLDALVGLVPVKREVKTLANFIEIQRKRRAAGLKEAPISYHCLFTGNPGTGKTTVARILADIYREMGVVKKGHLVETDRSGLIAEYVGQTAVKTNKIIDTALDGVLFIDEAYTLVQGGDRDYGGEAIATLLKRMEDDRDRLVVIMAGYTDEMKRFIDSNPGLQSRFSRFIQFPDYSADELAKIFLLTAQKSQYVCNRDVRASLEQIMERAVTEKDKNFGNGRFVRNLFEKAIQRQAVRLSTVAPLTSEMLSELTLHDLGFAYED